MTGCGEGRGPQGGTPHCAGRGVGWGLHLQSLTGLTASCHGNGGTRHRLPRAQPPLPPRQGGRFGLPAPAPSWLLQGNSRWQYRQQLLVSALVTLAVPWHKGAPLVTATHSGQGAHFPLGREAWPSSPVAHSRTARKWATLRTPFPGSQPWAWVAGWPEEGLPQDLPSPWPYFEGHLNWCSSRTPAWPWGLLAGSPTAQGALL